MRAWGERPHGSGPSLLKQEGIRQLALEFSVSAGKAMAVILATDPAQFSARTTSFGVTSTASSKSTAASTNSICILTTALSAIAIGTVLVAHLAPLGRMDSARTTRTFARARTRSLSG
ncbi:hypothetical protein ACWCQP_46750 [Streptomyces chartreusis]